MNEKDIKKRIFLSALSDRTKCDELLDGIDEYLNTVTPDPEGYSKVIISAAKLMECKTKSNEQLLKIFEIEKKNKPEKPDENLTEEEMDSIIDSKEEVEI